MADPKQVVLELQGTIERLHEKMDSSVDRAIELRDRGASEDALLTETAVAVGAAKALEGLTGVSWDERLERKALSEAGDAGVTAPEPVLGRRLRRRKARA